MVAIPTPFGTSPGKYAFLGSMGLENCYAEIQNEGGKARLVVVPSEGLVTLVSVADTPCRGGIYLEDLNVAYVCFSSSVYKVDSSFTATRIGTVPGSDTVKMTRNKSSPPQITIHCNSGTYFIASDSLAIIDHEDLPSDVVAVETLGEFTLFLGEDGTVTLSEQGETNLISGVFFTAEQSPDRGVELKVDRGEVFVFGEFTTEIWQFVGAVDAPFIFRTAIQRGCIAEHSVQTCDGSIMWIGQSKEGEKGVYRLEGLTPKKISTHEIDRLIEAESDPSVIKAFSYGRAGHAFYVVKGTNWTRAYDASTQQWHTRKSYGLDRWRAQFAFAAWSKIVVGDELTGKLFYLSDSTYTEDDGVMVRTTTAPSLHGFPAGLVVDRASFDVLVGQGLTSPTAQGYNPKMMVSKSIDGGNEFSFPREVLLGKRGVYNRRINTWRWGKTNGKGMVFRLSVSDPVPFSLALMDASVRQAAA